MVALGLEALQLGAALPQAVVQLFAALPGLRRRLLFGGQRAIEFMARLPEADQVVFDLVTLRGLFLEGGFGPLGGTMGGIKLAAQFGFQRGLLLGGLVPVHLDALQLGGVLAQPVFQVVAALSGPGGGQLLGFQFAAQFIANLLEGGQLQFKVFAAVGVLQFGFYALPLVGVFAQAVFQLFGAPLGLGPRLLFGPPLGVHF